MSSTLKFNALLAFLWAAAYLSIANAYPSHMSLGGLSERELSDVLPMLKAKMPATPPGPLKFNGTKLVHDKAHPWKPLRKGDLRGPCPGLNTLASHGYLPRNGVASPAQIINAVQEGFNMEGSTARFTTYFTHIVNGNLVTDLMSIGGKTKRTGPDPPAPAIVGGLNTHGTFEGDASITRADHFFGDNHSLNETLFEQFIEFSNRLGGGFYNPEVATELRWHRIQESIATNPEFDFTAPRFLTAYAESSFPFVFFVDGRDSSQNLSVANATLFFEESRFPDDFFRRADPSGASGVRDMHEAHPIKPGKNMNGINTYTHDPTSADLSDFCLLYRNIIKDTIKPLYPNPKGVLKRNLIINLGFFYQGLLDIGEDCEQEFPYGKL